MNQEQRALFDGAIALGKTASYAYRVAQGKHKLGGRTGPARLYGDLDIAAAWTRWKVDKDPLTRIANDLAIPYRTLQRRLSEYRKSDKAIMSKEAP